MDWKAKIIPMEFCLLYSERIKKGASELISPVNNFNFYLLSNNLSLYFNKILLVEYQSIFQPIVFDYEKNETLP